MNDDDFSRETPKVQHQRPDKRAWNAFAEATRSVSQVSVIQWPSKLIDHIQLFSTTRYYDIVRDVRQNKGSILKASVDYIRKLKSDQQKKRLLEDKIKLQDAQNKKLLLKIQVLLISTEQKIREITSAPP